MNELKIFENKEFGQVRTMLINGEPWFVGKDVAVALGYENPSKAIRDHVDAEDKIMGVQNVTPSVTDNMGRIQHPTWINESGVYALIFGSKLKSAKRFKHWVTSEVLPSIRKTGAYGGIDQEFIKLQMEFNKNVMETLAQLQKQNKQPDEKRTKEPKIKVCDNQFSLSERLKDLNGEFSYLSEMYGVERRMVMHKVYKLLESYIDPALDIWLGAYKEITGRREACTIHAVAYFDKLYESAMDMMEDPDIMEKLFG